MINELKAVVKNIPVIGPMAARLHLPFRNSSDYWERRYAKGGNSGVGSYGRLAKFKADFLNDFVKTNSVHSVLEFGCGDGSQLTLAQYPSYTGVDVSSKAIEICRALFAADLSKRFLHSDAPELTGTADLALSLDVVYHLVENAVFEKYMCRLFDSARRFVIVYSSNFDDSTPVEHVRHRCFTTWVEQNRPRWYVASKMANIYPYRADNPGDTSVADFYVFAPRKSGR